MGRWIGSSRRFKAFATTYRDKIRKKIRVTTAGPEPRQAAGRLMDTVCDKLGQMRPGMINVLMVATDRDFAGALDLNQAMARLKEPAERKEAGLFGRYGSANTADFFRYYLRLSGVLVRASEEQEGTAHSILWANNQAKHAIPGAIRTILQR